MSNSIRLPGIPKEIQSVDMRFETRYPILQRCFVYPVVASGPHAWRCVAYNISSAGIGVALPVRLDRGTMLNIHAYGLPDACPLQVQLRFCKQLESLWLSGCELSKRLSDADLRNWRSGSMAWVDECQPS